VLDIYTFKKTRKNYGKMAIPTENGRREANKHGVKRLKQKKKGEGAP